MADTKKKIKEPMVTTRKSVHVVFLSCPHCGQETEDIKMCPDCGEPMRIIDVVEKFGDEADAFLEKIKSNNVSKKPAHEEEGETDFLSTDKEEPNIILMGGDNALGSDDGGIDPSAADGDGLDVIFPDDEDAPAKPVETTGTDEDLADALAKLDEEEDDDLGIVDVEDIPEL